MHIAVCAMNQPSKYSGGRYYSWLMAEALAQAGHDVRYVTNNLPVFYDDFVSFPHHQDVRVHVSRNFRRNLPEGQWDVVFLVPGGRYLDFYLKVQHFASTRQARLVLLNFETPNWYNALSPTPRDPAFWDHWKRSSKQAALILSISAEGDRFARGFYDNLSDQVRFDYCYPPVNSIVADSVVGVQKEKRIILLTRFVFAEHKGGADTVELICEAMRGYTLVLVVGAGRVPSSLMDRFLRQAAEHGIKIEVKYKLTDLEKFREIKRSSLMLFPSFFEGFGLPPVEAQYCNVPCTTFDLPVLREVSGDGLVYVEPGHWQQFRSAIGDVLNSDNTYDYLQDNIAEVARFENYVERIDQVVRRVVQQDWHKEPPVERPTTAMMLYAELIGFGYRLVGLGRRLVGLGRRLVAAALRALLGEEKFQRIREYVHGKRG